MTDHTTPRPPQPQPHEAWWESHPERDGDLHTWLAGSGDDRTFIGTFAERCGAASVLECGPGLYLDHALVWAHRPGIAYTALDVTPRFVAAGRARGLDVRGGSIEAIPLPDASVDLAYCRDVLEHLSHWPTALAELARVSRRAFAVRFFRLAQTAQQDVIAFDTVADVRHLHHNTYAQAGLEAWLHTRGYAWEWHGYTPQPSDPSIGSAWLVAWRP